MKKSVWDLFHETFKIGDDIIIITDIDEFVVGEMVKFDEDACSIRVARNMPLRDVEWVDVRFMSHEGFPVKKLIGADGSRLIEKLDTKSTQETIRKALTRSVCGGCSKLGLSEGMHHYRGEIFHPGCYKVVGGDPFMIEAVEAKLWNPGNEDPFFWSGNPGEEFEECIELIARDGAVGHLFDLPSVYHFEM
jgi:hypothetical protein